MANLKHVGRMVRNQRRIVVAYRTLPGDAESCVVVTTENLMADEHDALMKLVESNAGQTAEELSDSMMRTVLPDGRNMLEAFHKTGKMVKAKTSEVEMTPDSKTVINLSELNKMIAEHKGVSIDDLAIQPNATRGDKPVEKKMEIVEDAQPVADVADEGVLTDEQLAAQYRSQADAMFKEAQKLRKQADGLSPAKTSKTKKTKESA
jgi:hypothetical protein